jgi:hypothetical protein
MKGANGKSEERSSDEVLTKEEEKMQFWQSYPTKFLALEELRLPGPKRKEMHRMKKTTYHIATTSVKDNRA